MQIDYSPIALLLLVVGCLALLFAPRRYALSALILVGLFVPMSNRIVIVSIDLMTHRLLVLVGVLGLCFRRDAHRITLNAIDKVVIALAVWSVFSYTALWGTSSGFVYSTGRSFDMIGLYFLFRIFLGSLEDWNHVVKTFGVGCVIFATFMVIESVTGRNLLSVLGGLDEAVWARRGRLRCRATFGHAISAGVFAAALMPLWLAAWKQEKFRKWALLGMFTCTVMTITSASSSSLLTYVAGIGAFFCWRWRHLMRPLRWGILFTLIGLHIVMKAPVWALLQRINVVGGSTGNYRYRLFDNFVNSFGEWWLFGLKDPEESFGMWDLCNQFVLEGVRGGFVRLALFVALLALCFREVGRVLATIEDLRALWIWALGAMLFAHFSAFWGYDYWDQIRVSLYLVFAAIASASQIVHASSEEDPIEDPESMDSEITIRPAVT